MGKRIAIGLLVAYLILVIDLTLVRYRTEHASHNFVPFRTIQHDVRAGGDEFRVNILGNLAVTAPFGLLVPVLLGPGTSAWKVAAISFGISLAIESAQGISGHRVADVDDLILNTLGGSIGYLLFRVGQGIFRRDPTTISRQR